MENDKSIQIIHNQLEIKFPKIPKMIIEKEIDNLILKMKLQDLKYFKQIEKL